MAFIDGVLGKLLGWMAIISVLLMAMLILNAQAQSSLYYSQQDRNRAIDNSLMIAKNTEQIDSMQRQLDSIQSMQLERRLTSLEGSMDDIKHILLGIAVAVGVMLLESAQRLLHLSVTRGKRHVET